MRVIALGTLNAFVRNRVDTRHPRAVQAQLDARYAEVVTAQWRSSAELKGQYRFASIVFAERVVFNIKGNDYRLVAAVSYHFQVVLIKWIGTHKAYDNIGVEQGTYDEDRYADPPY